MPELNHWFLAQCSSADELKGLFQDERIKWVYAERMEDVVLLNLAEFMESPVLLDRWQHLRAFGPELEVAWWQKPGETELRAFTNNGRPPKGFNWQPDALEHLIRPIGIEKILLVGEHDEAKAATDSRPAWSVARIPRYLYYPVKDGSPKRVILTVASYLINNVSREQRLIEVSGGESDG